MTKEKINISRRSVLGGLGAVGLASAGAGLGTTAYLNDTESFDENSITAGELDLKVDWEEHYYDGSSGGELVSSTDPGEGHVGFPDPENPHVWVAEEDVPTLMEATAIEAFPDPDNDRVQEMNYEDWSYAPCDMGADLPNHLDPSVEGALRSMNADTYDEDSEFPVKPLINLEDVKPGDFGELTLSFHLCDNPGYVWLQAANVSESENGLTEPEAEVDDTPDTPELAEQIQTAWWYDPNGNNLIDESLGKVDVMVAVDTSGSLSSDEVTDLQNAANTFSQDLLSSADAQVGGITFGGGTVNNFMGLSSSPLNFSGLTASGNTPMPAALEIAAAELDANGRSGAGSFIVLLTDGGPNYENKTYSAGGYTVGSGYTGGDMTPSGIVHDSELCETANIADNVRADHRILTVGIGDNKNPTGNDDPQDCDGNNIASLAQYLRDYIAGEDADYFSAEDPAAVSALTGAILDTISTSEEVFHRGTLADDLEVLADGSGIPLDGELSTPYDELSDPESHENRECFQPGANYFVGFAWWLPADVGNEVQGDSVSFDLGFYVEQCRHNDGSGSSST